MFSLPHEHIWMTASRTASCCVWVFRQMPPSARSTQATKKAVIPSDERKRVAATFKEFCEPGTSKASLSEVAALVKEVAKGTAAADSQVKTLISLAKEALMAKCAGGQLGSGDFINWYFSAWEELKAASTAEQKPVASKSKRPEQKPVVASKSASAERGRQVAGVDAGGAGGGSISGISGIIDGEAAAAAASPVRPYGWELAQGVQVEEYRRLLQLCCQFQRPTGARGLIPASQLQPLLRTALPDDTQLLQEVLTAVPTPERQPSDEEPALPVGVLIRFWFDDVLPRVSQRHERLESAAANMIQAHES